MYSCLVADHKGADALVTWLYSVVFIDMLTTPRPIEAVLLHSHVKVEQALLGDVQCLLRSSACC